MPVIDPDNAAALQTSDAYWQDELKNSRILLYKYNQAIAALTEAGVKSYSLDTGQSSQSVTRQDLAMLYKEQQTLTGRIRQLELFLGEGKPGVRNVFPGW